MRGFERLVEIVARFVGDVVIGELEGVGAVSHHRDLDVTDLVAIEACVLFADRGRGGAGCRGYSERQSSARGGSAQKQLAAAELNHASPPDMIALCGADDGG